MVALQAIAILMALFKKSWAPLVQPLPASALEAAEYFVKKYPDMASAYRLYRETALNVKTAYDAIRKLREYRLLMPVNEREYVATPKASIALLYYRGDARYLDHLRTMWRIDGVQDEDLLSYLVVLGSALSRLGFSMKEAFICNFNFTPFYILPFIGEGFGDLAKSLDLPAEVLRTAYSAYVEALGPYMVDVEGVKVFARKSGGGVKVLAAICPKYGDCDHQFPTDCPLVKHKARRLL